MRRVWIASSGAPLLVTQLLYRDDAGTGGRARLQPLARLRSAPVDQARGRMPRRSLTRPSGGSCYNNLRLSRPSMSREAWGNAMQVDLTRPGRGGHRRGAGHRPRDRRRVRRKRRAGRLHRSRRTPDGAGGRRSRAARLASRISPLPWMSPTAGKSTPSSRGSPSRQGASTSSSTMPASASRPPTARRSTSSRSRPGTRCCASISPACSASAARSFLT